MEFPQQRKLNIQLMHCESSRVPLFRVFFLPCRLASDGHAQLLLGRGFLFCLPFITNASSQPFPLFQPMPHFATQALTLFFLQALSLQPLTPPCVTGFFLITDPSSCYYSNPLLYNMPFYMRFHKGPIWSEGYGVRSWEMQLHGGNLCVGQNGGLTSSLLMHSSGHSGPSLTCWAHWIQ